MVKSQVTTQTVESVSLGRKSLVLVDLHEKIKKHKVFLLLMFLAFAAVIILLVFRLTGVIGENVVTIIEENKKLYIDPVITPNATTLPAGLPQAIPGDVIALIVLAVIGFIGIMLLSYILYKYRGKSAGIQSNSNQPENDPLVEKLQKLFDEDYKKKPISLSMDGYIPPNYMEEGPDLSPVEIAKIKILPPPVPDAPRPPSRRNSLVVVNSKVLEKAEKLVELPIEELRKVLDLEQPKPENLNSKRRDSNASFVSALESSNEIDQVKYPRSLRTSVFGDEDDNGRSSSKKRRASNAAEISFVDFVKDTGTYLAAEYPKTKRIFGQQAVIDGKVGPGYTIKINPAPRLVQRSATDFGYGD